MEGPPQVQPESSNGRIRGFIQDRPIVSLVIACVVGLLIGAGIGVASRDTEVTDLEDQVTSLETDLEDAEDAADAAEEEAADAEAALAPLEEKVAKLNEQKDDLAAQEEELAEQAQDLSAREADVTAAEQTLESNTIPDGIWQLGRDYEAGTYRAEGGSGCYWALLGSADTSDIINNGGFSPNQTITIDSPYFETDGCGEWVKIE